MAAQDAVNLDGLRSLTQVLARLPQGTQARAVAERLGLWSTGAHETASNRQKIFPAALSRLEDPQLSDEYAYWLSEVSRATELCGLLEGQRVLLGLQAKSVRAAARATLRRKYELEAQEAASEGKAKPKPPTIAQLNDEVEESADVRDVDDSIGLLSVIQESAKAYKESCLAATAGLSREISFRQAQLGARIRL